MQMLRLGVTLISALILNLDAPPCDQANMHVAKIVDGWVLPVVELERVTHARDALLDPQEYFFPDDDSREPIHPAELRYVAILACRGLA